MKRRNFNHNDINKAILLTISLCIVVLFVYLMFNYQSFSGDISGLFIAVRPVLIAVVDELGKMVEKSPKTVGDRHAVLRHRERSAHDIVDKDMVH